MEKTDTALGHDGKYSKLYRVVTDANESAKHLRVRICVSSASEDWADTLNGTF